MLEERGGVPVVGVIPQLPALAIPEEDAVALDAAGSRLTLAAVDVAVIRLPRIANFDDFDPLQAEPGVRVRYVSSPHEFGTPQAVILPGTKSTAADLAWLRASGLAESVCDFAARGGAVVGVCGGYQMLGRVIRDPAGVESGIEEVAGLGLLPVETSFVREKATYQARARVLGGPGWLSAAAGETANGYEIHMGRTGGGRAWLEITTRNGQAAGLPDGAVSDDGRVWGCYLHGLFANAGLRRAWLASVGHSTAPALRGSLAESLDRLADAVGAALDLQRLETIIRESV
jgi:adenosylcobyric acid synthase